jgi:hypothetical protein
MDMPPDRQQWYEHLCRFGGANATVHEYRDHAGAHGVEIFRGVSDGGVLLATIGLMDVDRSPHPGAAVFSEILMDTWNQDDKMGSVLATVAFHVMKHNLRVAPGVLFEHVIGEYFPGHSLPHVMLVAPFQWETGMTKVELASKTIYPLVGVPVSDAERAFAVSRSPLELEHAWASQRVNVFDWDRASAV